MPALLFNNHDGCGDYLVAWGQVQLQPINTITNLAFVLAGLPVAAYSRTVEARCNGVLLVAVGWFSALYHATSSWGGFLLDISAMAVWAGHLMFCCRAAYHSLSSLEHGPDTAHEADCVSKTGQACAAPLQSQAKHLAVITLFVAVALTGPFLSFEALGARPTQTWDVWANSFLVLILVAVLPPLYAAHCAGVLLRIRVPVAAAIASIVVGVIFTQLIRSLCVPGHFTKMPLHSMWHVCSALSAYLTIGIVDDVLCIEAVTDPNHGSDLATPASVIGKVGREDDGVSIGSSAGRPSTGRLLKRASSPSPQQT